jgi:uncharacterized protein GlcG (DUF336 family)
MEVHAQRANHRFSFRLESLETRNLLSVGGVIHPHPGLHLAVSRPAEIRTIHTSLPHLSRREIQTILDQAVVTAQHVASADGLRSNADPSLGPVVVNPTRMQLAIVDRDGRLLGSRSMPDAWVGSIDIAIAKARTAAFFSSDENALTSRTIGVLSQAHNPNGTGGAGPLWGIGDSNQPGITGGPQLRNGIITFPGGVPLYKDGRLVGGIGVSGDGVDQDEFVAFGGATGFGPGPDVVKNFTHPPVRTLV